MGSGERGSERKGDTKAFWMIYGIVGSVFLFFSILHILSVVITLPDLLAFLRVPSDPIIGVVLLIASILFYLGSYRTLSGLEDSRAYIMVGWFMGALVSFVSLLVMLSNGIRSFLIGAEDLADWIFLDDVVPGLYLGSMILLLIPVIIEHGKRDRHSIGKKGVRSNDD